MFQLSRNVTKRVISESRLTFHKDFQYLHKTPSPTIHAGAQHVRVQIPITQNYAKQLHSSNSYSCMAAWYSTIIIIPKCKSSLNKTHLLHPSVLHSQKMNWWQCSWNSQAGPKDYRVEDAWRCVTDICSCEQNSKHLFKNL